MPVPAVEEDFEGAPATAVGNRTLLRVGLGLVEPDRQVPEEGLRERKKRLTRQLLSDTATQMFVAQGFDEVTIADIAAACGVSEKTVWNYFPAKETLLLDVEDATADAIRREIGQGGSPVEAMLRVLDLDLQQVTDYLVADPPAATFMIRRFKELVDSVPSLGSYHRDMMDRLIDVTANAVADRLGTTTDGPETQITATSLVGMFRVQQRVIGRLANGVTGPHELQQRVRSEVRRAATVIERGVQADADWATVKKPIGTRTADEEPRARPLGGGPSQDLDRPND